MEPEALTAGTNVLLLMVPLFARLPEVMVTAADVPVTLMSARAGYCHDVASARTDAPSSRALVRFGAEARMRESSWQYGFGVKRGPGADGAPGRSCFKG
ncbi:hypothetical protein Y958_10605 [Nitrospirillum viridazoti CBAmc]|uniref:Uncharacterized protein n=1 Tax=Nitrospirillum viridazoti CBAmc TaxID=1441467 RepID=A0A248JR49_9PROT|nr:hypothetical protein Y958_10605 [Nitrospirillum amazonense CBAmc]